MDIYLDQADNITQAKYEDFAKQVQTLLAQYEKKDQRRFELVKKNIEQTNGQWDTSINLIRGDSVQEVNITQLLAYEYCLAGERITDRQVSFETMLDKLFSGVDKFRIGNPILGEDDECLYGKSLDDETAIPITSKLYRMVMNAGAQHLSYIKDGKVTGAVFIYEKGVMKGIAKDEFGNPVDLETDGIDFRNFRGQRSLLTTLRQATFHEWTHNAEREIIDSANPPISYETRSEDGKIYRNYEKEKHYYTYGTRQGFTEPQYIISTEKDENNSRKRFHIDKNGKLRPIWEVRFGLEPGELPDQYCYSQGLSTTEILPNGDTIKHNNIREGFVEATARAMVRAIDPQAKDIDEGHYPLFVGMALKVINSRDKSLGLRGKTFADLLTHSTTLKRDLESRIVTKEDGRKIDGLHYLSECALDLQNGRTRRAKLMKRKKEILKRLGLSKQQIMRIRESGILGKKKLSKEDCSYLKALFMGSNPDNAYYVESLVEEISGILEEESTFYDRIPSKLGYETKEIEKDQNSDIADDTDVPS